MANYNAIYKRFVIELSSEHPEYDVIPLLPQLLNKGVITMHEKVWIESHRAPAEKIFVRNFFYMLPFKFI